MNKEELLNKKLYLVKSNLTETPYFVNAEFFVLFTEPQRAFDFAQRISKRVGLKFTTGGNSVIACEITNNDAFFQEMMRIGFSKFTLDEGGTILNLTSIYERETNVSAAEKELYIYYMGYLKMQKSSHIGSVKTQKISAAKQYLNSGKNNAMMQHFIQSQNKIKSLVKGFSATSIPAAPVQNTQKQQEAWPPIEDVNVLDENEKDQASTPIVDSEKIKDVVDTVQTVPSVNKEPQNAVLVSKEKNSRPIVATIMFILAAFFALAFIGSTPDDIPSMYAYGVTVLCFCGLGFVMTKKHLKQFGWTIIAVFFLMTSVGYLFSGKSIVTAVVCLIIAVLFASMFAFANRKK